MLAVARSAHYAGELSHCEASASTPGFCSGEVTRAAVPLVLGAVQALLSVLALTTAVLVAGRRAAGGALGWVAGAGTLPPRLLLAAGLWSEAGRDSLYREDPPWPVAGGAAAIATVGALATALGVLVLTLPQSRRALPASPAALPLAARRPWPRALVVAASSDGAAVAASVLAPSRSPHSSSPTTHSIRTAPRLVVRRPPPASTLPPPRPDSWCSACSGSRSRSTSRLSPS